jgi:hypothetical protein
MYSTFSGEYGGLVPTGKYLSTVYNLYFATIEEHLEKEVKKRGGEQLNWDASYKEAKHLARHHGNPIYKALITATNGFGEIRLQFHVHTDGHDQMIKPLQAFSETVAAYGVQLTSLFGTDKPAVD